MEPWKEAGLGLCPETATVKALDPYEYPVWFMTCTYTLRRPVVGV
jgi:hypothetical protein